MIVDANATLVSADGEATPATLLRRQFIRPGRRRAFPRQSPAGFTHGRSITLIDDNIFFEEFPGFRYLMIYGHAPTSEPATSTENSLTIPFQGDFRYCQLKAALGGYNDCSQVPAAQIVEFRSCSSTHDVMVFTKR